tara:strand:+ start:3151 stop:5316 length:2166 start_codon:yes stop_codon:yes gene_type:complete
MSGNIALTIILRDYQVIPISTKSILKNFKIIEDNSELIISSEYPGGNIQELIILIKGFTKKNTYKLKNLISDISDIPLTKDTSNIPVTKDISDNINSRIRRPLGLVNGGGIDSILDKLSLLLYIFYGSLIFEDNFFELNTIQNDTVEQKGGTKHTNASASFLEPSKEDAVYSEITDNKANIEDHESWIMSNDSRREVIGVRLYQKGGTSMSFAIKLSVNKHLYTPYRREIMIYQSLYNSPNKKWDVENVVKYYNPTPTVSPSSNQSDFNVHDNITSLNITKIDENEEDTITIDIENIGKILLDISDYIDIGEEQRPIGSSEEEWYIAGRKCIYFVTEWDKNYNTLENYYNVIPPNERNSFMLKIYENVTNTLKDLSDIVSFYHGDLKADNVLCNLNGDIRMFDFDFSGILDENVGGFLPVKNGRVVRMINKVKHISSDSKLAEKSWSDEHKALIEVFRVYSLLTNAPRGTYPSRDDPIYSVLEEKKFRSLMGTYPTQEDRYFMYFYDLHRFTTNNTFHLRISPDFISQQGLFLSSVPSMKNSFSSAGLSIETFYQKLYISVRTAVSFMERQDDWNEEAMRSSRIIYDNLLDINFKQSFNLHDNSFKNKIHFGNNTDDILSISSSFLNTPDTGHESYETKIQESSDEEKKQESSYEEKTYNKYENNMEIENITGTFFPTNNFIDSPQSWRDPTSTDRMEDESTHVPYPFSPIDVHKDHDDQL